MAQITQTVAQGILDGQGYTDNEVRQLAHFWLSARAPADSVTAPAGEVLESEDMRRARHIAVVAQRWIGDRTGLGALLYIGDLAWALKTLAAATTPPAQAADSVLEDAALLQEARTALWQPANVDLCERIDAYLDAARKQGANHD